LNAGSNTSCTATRDTSITATSFKNPLDYAGSSSDSSSIKEQCLWCEYYYPSGSDNTSSGKRGDNLAFGFTYNDLGGGKLLSYEYVLTPEVISNGNPLSATKKISGNLSGLSFSSGSSVIIQGFSMTTGSINSTLKQIPYDGNIYYLWIRLTNDKGQVSSWISSDKPFEVPDHKWPRAAIVSGTLEVNKPAQLCSTAINSLDPCLSLCWSNPSQPFSFSPGTEQSSQLESSDWKCSVCYDRDGKAILCQDVPKDGRSSNFAWEVTDEDAITPPVIPPINQSNVQSWWKYGASIQNNETVHNPVIQLMQSTTSKAKARLSVFGSECPIQASLNARSIRPIWIEK
jgi:hypothetical protein